MKKILMLTSLLLGFVMQVNAYCSYLSVTNNTACTLYFYALVYTPPSCTVTAYTQFIQIPAGVTITRCISDPIIPWASGTPNGVTDGWVAVKVFTEPNAPCGGNTTIVGVPGCGYPTTSSFVANTSSTCPYAACAVVNCTWSNPSNGHWLVTLN